MQDPTAALAFQAMKPQFPEQEQLLKCPRCESTNTKFCYYNNYNLSQPRHFCKNCRRYWTKGGALRNIPVGGGTRKNSKRSSSAAATNPKRPSSSSSSSSSNPSSSTPTTPIQIPKPEPISIYPLVDQDRHLIDVGGSFSSLLTSNGQFGNLLESFHGGLGINSGDMNRPIVASGLELQRSNDEDPTPMPENFLGLQGESSCWSGGWPDLAIYTPGSSFQ